MSLFWWDFHCWLHWGLSKWQHSVRPVTGVLSEFPLQCQWICTMMMFYPAPTDGHYSNGLPCLILLIYHMCLIFMYTSFYIIVSLILLLLRLTTNLLWLILSVPICIDLTMCMLMLLLDDSCAMLALYVSIKFLLTYYEDRKEEASMWCSLLYHSWEQILWWHASMGLSVDKVSGTFWKKILAQFTSFTLMGRVSWTLFIFVFLAWISVLRWPNIWAKMFFFRSF